MENKVQTTKIVTVFGGSGFVGSYVVKALAQRGYHVRVAVRRPDLAFHLQPLGNVGQIKAVQANLRFDWSVKRAIEGCDAVVNLVGILSPRGKQKFYNVQCQGAGLVARHCKNAGVPLVHVSAIGADENSDSHYCASKGGGEKLVRSILSSAVILRPSIIFGQGDGFFSRFAQLASRFPLLPLLGGGTNTFQPVYVGDVAKAVTLGIDGKLSSGKTYELGGARTLSFRECMDLVLSITGRNNGFVSIPWFAARWMAKLTGWIPGAPLTSDQVKIMREDNVVSQTAIRQKRTLEGMGITPKSLEAILPGYLVSYRRNGQFGNASEGQLDDA